MRLFRYSNIPFFIIFTSFFGKSSAEINSDYLKIYEEHFSRGIVRVLAEFLSQNGENVYAGYQNCLDDFRLLNLTSLWTLKLLDANGKLPSGVLEGNVHSLGSFDECLSVYHEASDGHEIRGKYCFAKLPLPLGEDESDEASFLRKIRVLNAMDGKGGEQSRTAANIDGYNRISFNWAVCIPDSCEAETIQKMLRDYLTSVGVALPDNPLITVPEDQCSYLAKETEFSAGAIGAIVVLSIFAAVMVSSTCYDYFSKDRNGLNRDSRLHQVLIAFSLYTNTQKLIKTNKSSSNLRCVNGIRVLSMFWIIMGHRYTSAAVYPLLNHFEIQNWVKTYGSTFILNGTMAVDTFFTLSGLLLAYTFFNQFSGRRTFNVGLFYLHRMLRLWPAMAMTVFVQTYLYPYFSDGPYWPYTANLIVGSCYEYWWSTLLYVSNYVNPMVQCVGQIWYLCCDTQLYILSPILLYPLLVKPKFGIINLIFWILAAQVTVTTISYLNEWPGSTGGTQDFDFESYLVKYYNATHMRATPWLLGFAGGYLLIQYASKTIRMKKPIILVYWIILLGIMASIIFGSITVQGFDHKITKAEDATFLAFARQAWSIAVIMMIFACTKGYGGPINWFLSWRLWEVVGRLTYSMYLLHIGVQYWQRGSMRTEEEFSHIQFVYASIGDLAFSIGVSYLWAMAFESPFLALEKALLGKKKTEPAKTDAKL